MCVLSVERRLKMISDRPEYVKLIFFINITLIMRAVVTVEMTLVGKHVSVPSGVLSANWFKFPWAITFASNHSRRLVGIRH